MTSFNAIYAIKHPRYEQVWNDKQIQAPHLKQPQIRFWTYTAPGLVFGSSQRKAFEIKATQDNAVTIRNSGGGAVLTGPWMLSTSVILPRSHPLASPGIIESYRWFGIAHATALQQLGIRAIAIPPNRLDDFCQARSDLDWACFGNCSPWELAVASRKIVGIAQRRTSKGVLLTSGILIAKPQWQNLEHFLPDYAHHENCLAQRTTSCEEELGRPVAARTLLKKLVPLLIGKLFPVLDQPEASSA